MSMATKHDMFGIYNEELPYIKPQRSFHQVVLRSQVKY